jgi:hypothetical protein
MNRNLLTNPISGKLIQKTSLVNTSSIINNFFFISKQKKTKITKKKIIIKPNITDKEYIQKYFLSNNFF